MTQNRHVVLHQSPQNRSFGALTTAADVLWGHALRWTTQFGLIPPSPLFQAYIERVTSRPASARVTAKDAELLAAREP